MYQEHKRNEDARSSILKGINTVADIVADTIGPFGKNVCINNIITNDGVTIAKSINLTDQFENAGAYLIKDAANKTNQKVGDGTTTTTVLARELSNRFSKLSKTMSGNTIRELAKKSLEKIIKGLRDSAIPCDGIELLTNIATNSVENKEIGRMIAETVLEVGKDGVIKTAESKTGDTYKEIFKGVKIERGYVSPFMATNTNKMIAEYHNIPVLVTDKTINDTDEIIGILQSLKSAYTGNDVPQLLIICDNMGPEVIADLIENSNKRLINTLVVRGVLGTQKKGGNEDIAILTGAKFFSEERNDDISNASIYDLGFVEKVVANKNETILINGKGDEKLIASRINAIKSELELSTSEYEQSKLKERIAKLGAGIGIIYIGGDSDYERGYLSDKIEDSINATQSAYKNGVTIGGGYGLLFKANEVLDKDDNAVAKEIIYACSKPIEQIWTNNDNYDEDLITRIISEANRGYVYNVFDGSIIENPIDMGLVDPVEVEIEAIKNSISVASILVSTNTVIVDIIENKDKIYE